VILDKETAPPHPDRTPDALSGQERVLGVWTWRGFRPAITLLRDGFIWRGKKYAFSDVIGLSRQPRDRGFSGLFGSRGCHLVLRDGQVLSIPADIERQGEHPLPESWLTPTEPFGDLVHALENQLPTRSFAEFIRLVRKRSNPEPFVPPPERIVPIALLAGWLLGGVFGLLCARHRGHAELGGLLSGCLLGSCVLLAAGILAGYWFRRRSWQRRVAALRARDPTGRGRAGPVTIP
jgi:hypothetical protein